MKKISLFVLTVSFGIASLGIIQAEAGLRDMFKRNDEAQPAVTVRNVKIKNVKSTDIINCKERQDRQFSSGLGEELLSQLSTLSGARLLDPSRLIQSQLSGYECVEMANAEDFESIIYDEKMEQYAQSAEDSETVMGSAWNYLKLGVRGVGKGVSATRSSLKTGVGIQGIRAYLKADDFNTSPIDRSGNGTLQIKIVFESSRLHTGMLRATMGNATISRRYQIVDAHLSFVDGILVAFEAPLQSTTKFGTDLKLDLPNLGKMYFTYRNLSQNEQAAVLLEEQFAQFVEKSGGEIALDIEAMILALLVPKEETFSEVAPQLNEIIDFAGSLTIDEKGKKLLDRGTVKSVRNAITGILENEAAIQSQLDGYLWAGDSFRGSDFSGISLPIFE